MTAILVYWAWCTAAFAVGAVLAAVAVTVLVPARTARDAVHLLTEDARAALAVSTESSSGATVDPQGAELGELALDEALLDDSTRPAGTPLHRDGRPVVVRRRVEWLDGPTDEVVLPAEGRS